MRTDVQGPNLTGVSIRATTSLHPETVTGVSTGAVAAPAAARRPRSPGLPVDARAVDSRALSEALRVADGDANRLWFSGGDVWILNHHRAERCTSPACPACNPR